MDIMPTFNDKAKEEVRSRIDITSVVSRYVALKPAGQSLKGLCPFHQERTPSFHVNPIHGFFHCFGCGKGGDIFTFIQEIEGVGFPEALSMLAEECGVNLKSYAAEKSGNGSAGKDSKQVAVRENLAKTELLRIHEIASRFFYGNLKTSPAAVEYLKSRGLKRETVRDFRLGFAPEGWRGLIEYFIDMGVSEPVLTACGLALRKDNGVFYDRFRNRLMFPLFDLSGRVIGFAGRGMDNDAVPKYLNSPETPLYKKKRFLYGLDRSRTAIKESGCVLVVEGYMDYLTLYQAGICNVAAASGTALTPEHAHLLSRFTHDIILTFDGDSAGQSAAERAVFTLAPLNLDLWILILPEDEDPDSMVRKHGREGFEEFIKKRRPWDEFIIDRMILTHHAETARGKSAVIDACVPLIKAIDDPIVAGRFRKLLAEKLGLEERLVNKKFPESKAGPLYIRHSLKPLTQDAAYSTTLEGKFLHLLFLDPSLIEEARKYVLPETLTDSVSGDIYSVMLKAYDSERHFNNVANYTDDPEIKRIISLLQVKEDAKEHIQEEFAQKIIHLRRKYLRHRLQECTLRMKREPHLRNELSLLQNEYLMQLKELKETEL